MSKDIKIKQQLFMKYLLEGMSEVDAYEKAGYKRNRSHSSRLKKNLW